MVLQMSEKRFVKDHSYLVNYDKYCILDKVQHKHLYLDEVVDMLNEQQAEIERLQKIIDLTSYQLKVQDRILKEVGE